MPSLPGHRPAVLLELDLTEAPADPDTHDPLARLRSRGRRLLRPTLRALHEAGASFADVVRVRYILPRREDFEPCWPLLAAAFGAHPPAATMVEAGLIDPRHRIEIEVNARLATAP